MIGQNDDDIPPPTGTISTATTLPPPPVMEAVQMSPVTAANTTTGDDDLKLDDEEGDVDQSSVEQVIPLDKLKNGATQAMAGLSWFTSTLSQKAAEAKKNLEENTTYQSSVAGFNAQLEKARQSEVGRVS